MKCIECAFFWREDFENHPYCHFDGDDCNAPCADANEYEPEDDFDMWVERNGGEVYELHS